MATATQNRPAPPPPTAPARAAPAPAATPTRIVAPLQRREHLAPKIVFNAVEGFGKTSLAAYAPSPMVLMSEQGLQTLIDAGRVPESVPAATVKDWPDLLGWLDALVAEPQGVRTLALDALVGFERMCHEFICARDFGNDWGERGFASFQKGYDLSAGEWLSLLARLDRLNARHGMTILLLGHVNVTTFKNPEGADYDQFTANVHRKTWDATAKWADAVLFGNFFSALKNTDKGEKRGKVIHTNQRIVYTERHGAVIAKNRFGMPSQIEMPDDPAQNWPTVWQAITGNGN